VSSSRSGVRIWNSLSNEFRQMSKTKFKCNIHNMLLQKLSEANEYIDVLDLNTVCLENWTFYICIILPASLVICLIFLWILFCFGFFVFAFLFCKCYTGQYSIIIIIIIILFSICFLFWFHYLIPTSYFSKLFFLYYKNSIWLHASNHCFPWIAVANCKQWYIIFLMCQTL